MDKNLAERIARNLVEKIVEDLKNEEIQAF
jgi:hypothetical protein